MSGGKGLSVRVSEAPQGSLAVRAWFTVRDDPGQAWEVYRVGIPTDLGPPAIERVHRFTPTVFETRDELETAAPPFREFPLLAQGSLGTLRNLETGRECSFGGDLAAVEVAGPGPNSYTVLAFDAAAATLREIDPITCDEAPPVTLPGRIVDMALLDDERWGSVFLADNINGRIYRQDRGRPLRTLDLCAPGEPCDLGPRTLEAVGLICSAPVTPCRKQAAGDACCGVGEICDPTTVLLSWDPGLCPQTSTQRVWCLCLDDEPACPCYCDCDSPLPQPGCECPAPGVFAPTAAAIAGGVGTDTTIGLILTLGGTGSSRRPFPGRARRCTTPAVSGRTTRSRRRTSRPPGPSGSAVGRGANERHRGAVRSGRWLFLVMLWGAACGSQTPESEPEPAATPPPAPAPSLEQILEGLADCPAGDEPWLVAVLRTPKDSRRAPRAPARGTQAEPESLRRRAPARLPASAGRRQPPRA